MGKLLRFRNPSREKKFVKAAESGKEALYASVSEGNAVHIDDVTIALARTAYECFYSFHSGGRHPDEICQEIDDFLELMKENLPKVKKNIWEWSKDEPS